MAHKMVILPEEAFIKMLKALPEDMLINLFWKTLIKSDESPLSQQEKKNINKGIIEYKKRKTVAWENIK